MSSESSFIQFDLVSPERKLLSEAVTMVVIPGTEGDFGVLRGHAPLISSIRTGVVKVYPTSLKDTPAKIFIAGGFADVTEAQCTILAEQAIAVADINEAALDRDIQNMKDELSVANDAEDVRKLQNRLDLALAKKAAIAA